MMENASFQKTQKIRALYAHDGSIQYYVYLTMTIIADRQRKSKRKLLKKVILDKRRRSCYNRTVKRE